MAIFHTPLVTGSPATSIEFNQRLQQLDNAIQQSIEWRSFNVKAYPYNALGNGNSQAVDKTAFENAIADASEWAINPAKGGVVEVPAGRYVFDGALEITDTISNVAIVGVENYGSTSSQKASNIRQIDNSARVFDLGADKASHIIFKDLAIIGVLGTNLAHEGIYAEGCHDLIFENMFFYGFGGSAIRLGTALDTAIANTLKNIFVTGCMNGHASLADYAGVIDIIGHENFFWEGNINGPSGDFGVAVTDGGNLHLGETGGGVVGSGFLAAVKASGGLFHMYFVTCAFAHWGAFLTLGNGSDIAHNRFEFNQRSGLWTKGIRGRYVANRFQDNSQEGNGLYPHVIIGDGGSPTNGYANVWDANAFHAINYTAYKPNYAYDVRANGGTAHNLANTIDNSEGDGYTTALVLRTGASPVKLPADAYRQSYSVSTDAQTITFNAQLGRTWRAHLTSTALNVFFAAPTNAIEGMRASIEIFNQTGSTLTSVTFDAVFKMGTLTMPANGKRRTTSVEFDGTNWIQSGDWSPDL